MEPHHHEHNHRVTSLNKAFIIGIVLNISFVIVEFGVGFYYDSLGLLSDAGHNLGDVASLILAMLAFRLEKVHPNSRYTYGYKKSTILVSLLNAVILLVAVGIIIAESIDKLFHPVCRWSPKKNGILPALRYTKHGADILPSQPNHKHPLLFYNVQTVRTIYNSQDIYRI